MSCQRGNLTKRAQKHKNVKVFKNDMHDVSQRTKMLNRMEIEGVCNRCKQIIDWKIKYKKYKPLSVPKKCTKCQQKKVKFAYHIVCGSCAEKNSCCAKCGQDMDLSERPSQLLLSPEDFARNDKCNHSLEELSQCDVLQSAPDDENPMIDCLNKLRVCAESAADEPSKTSLRGEALAIDVNKEIQCAECLTVCAQLNSLEES